MMLPSNSVRATRSSIGHVPGSRVVTRTKYALLVKGSLFDIAHFQKCVRRPVEIRNASLFPNISSQQSILKKGPRGFRRRSKSGRKRPGEGSDSGGAIAERHSADYKGPGP